MTDENIISWNMPNWITVVLMVTITWGVLGFLAALTFGKTARLGGKRDHRNG